MAGVECMRAARHVVACIGGRADTKDDRSVTLPITAMADVAATVTNAVGRVIVWVLQKKLRLSGMGKNGGSRGQGEKEGWGGEQVYLTPPVSWVSHPSCS